MLKKPQSLTSLHCCKYYSVPVGLRFKHLFTNSKRFILHLLNYSTHSFLSKFLSTTSIYSYFVSYVLWLSITIYFSRRLFYFFTNIQFKYLKKFDTFILKHEIYTLSLALRYFVPRNFPTINLLCHACPKLFVSNCNISSVLSILKRNPVKTT